MPSTDDSRGPLPTGQLAAQRRARPNEQTVPIGARQAGPRPTGVLVVDPVPLFVEGLCAVLAKTSSVRVLGVTANMHTAINLAERTRPDIVLLDAMLDPRCHLVRLLSSGPASGGPVGAGPAGPTGPAVLSVLREPLKTPGYLSAAAAVGVPGFVLRSAEPARMVEAIRRLHAERHYLDPELSALAGGLGVRQAAHVRQPLSRREYQVVQLISEGMENLEIARELFVGVETVRTHVKSILRKLHARDRTHAVALAFRLGVLVPRREENTNVAPQRSGHGHLDSQSLARVTSR